MPGGRVAGRSRFRRGGKWQGLPPVPMVDVAISRRADTDADEAVNSLERLLRRTFAGNR
jgi:hypothetical protein